MSSPQALHSAETKTTLIAFLATEWATDRYAPQLQGKTLFVTVGSECYQYTSDGTTVEKTAVESLKCTHEEADTRVILHANHASQTYETIVIRANDTDVEILAIHYEQFISAKIILRSISSSGGTTRTRLVDIKKVANGLGQAVSSALLGLHAFTGCDSVSCFVGKGKAEALSLCKNNTNFQNAFQELGENFSVSNTLAICLEQFVCKLYKTNQECVNESRYQLFTKLQNVDPHMLLPSKNALTLHILRANYQAGIWRRTLCPDPTIPDPVGNGWTRRGEKLEVLWIDNLPAPQAILQLVTCGCKSVCDTRRCTCLKNGLPCTDACKCPDTCVNL